MLITYFKNPATLARCRSGLAHPYLEDFVVWLEQQGYRRRTICYHVCEVIHFANWAEAEGLARRDLNLDALAAGASILLEHPENQVLDQALANPSFCGSVKLFAITHAGIRRLP